jgi:uncharacterized membrane protein
LKDRKNNIQVTIVYIIIALCFLPNVLNFFSIFSTSEDEEANSINDYARIIDMDYKAVLVDEPDSEGKIVVTERMTFDIHAASKNNGFWELWRDLCEDNIDGVRVHYKVNSVKQILPDGTEVVWPESPQLYWDDWDYESTNTYLGPGKWFHSPGPYNEYAQDYECVFFYIDNVYRDKMTFEIEYEMYNAALRYGDCSDLYIAMYSGDTTKYLESFNAEILIPEKDMPKAENYKFTTYGTKDFSFPVKESKTKNPGYHTFYFNLDKDDLKFKKTNEFIEFDLVSYGEDKHKFTDYASINDYYNDYVLDEIWEEQNEYAMQAIVWGKIKLGVAAVCGTLGFIVLIFGITKIPRYRKKYKINTSNHKNTLFRDIPSDLDPKFAAALVHCKEKKSEDDASVYSAILLSLARKGYITLKDSAGDILIILNDRDNDIQPFQDIDEASDSLVLDEFAENHEPLTPSEIYYLNLIKRHTVDAIYMDSLRAEILDDYTYTSNFDSNIEKIVVNLGVKEKYFQKPTFKLPRLKLASSGVTHIIFGIIFLLLNLLTFQTPIEFAYGSLFLLGIICISLGIYFKTQSHKFVLLTEYGEEEYKKWKGLYNFLKSDTLISERTFIELPLWEKYLVYATAFGISEKVVEAIKVRCPQFEMTDSIVSKNHSRIRTSGTHFHSTIRSSRHASIANSYGGGGSGSSGGFGYGGGGRGGGGGGGGH